MGFLEKNEPCELYRLIPREMTKTIFKKVPELSTELDYTFLGFEDVYKAATLFVPKDRVILDLGCGYAFQSWYFRDYRKYIGVDHDSSAAFDVLDQFEIDQAQFFYQSIDMFLKTTFPCLPYTVDDVFAICSYVPDEKARELVRKTFPNCLVYYPA